ncbi:MAG: LLM class flavin-dependent oxidoreductase [Pegethrix bostrychoides GSE-TBD4-15B]|uniref:LLM class flavin-dependent oxidoreductase n=1 Tax=Pegethrix bostrychoides GSE-TBD4-15B TaxID=2839662 RepID=A0A951PEL5_9CYAN|nr:LLM class flavin-dependent oxidoreductase [Pegethrix bostrychoides GSE-TBD4-15B]
MKTGLFCTYENPYQDAHRAIAEQTALVQQAEALGFEEAWITEHHFSDFHVSPSIMVLMAYLAGVTSRIRLGTAAVLLAFHNPVTVAEDVATLDHLSQGRLLLGVAKGGPFPEQNQHFGIAMSESRRRMLEALELLEKLLYGSEVSFDGTYYQCDRLTVHPKPLQAHIPVYLATSDREAIELAALHSFGLMGGAPFSLNRLKTNLAQYRAINSSGSEQFVLSRFFFVSQTDEAAIQESLPFIRSFVTRMTKNVASLKQDGNTQHLKPSANQQTCFDETYLLENSIIGSVATCRDKIKRLQDELNLGTLALKPCSFDLQQNLASLTCYAEQVRDAVSA